MIEASKARRSRGAATFGLQERETLVVRLILLLKSLLDYLLMKITRSTF